MVTNMDGDGTQIIRWHWAKHGSTENGHEVAKNQLGAAVLPRADSVYPITRQPDD
ncbi:MAG: hypothetical protein J7M25_06045 [Deltaproteobacteria bacterium]|nr:hypothetical protein [Deltaproteobacteria bacterium]